MSIRALLPIIQPPDVLRPAGPDGALPPVTVFLPKEHGSWSLALEPLALGLLLAPSAAGAALATAAIAGFFARRPLKALFHAESKHHRTAFPVLVLLATLAVAGLGEAALLGGPAALWPLLLAVPFGGLFAYFDAQGDSRAAVAELAGCATFAFLPVALATLAGWPVPAALALAGLSLGRSLPTVLTVRTYLRLSKQPAPKIWVPLAGGVAAVGLIGSLADRQLVPSLAVGLAGLLLLRTLFLVTKFRPAWPARRVGFLEAGLGLLYVAGLALAYRFP
jgi:YwiC-like protein